MSWWNRSRVAIVVNSLLVHAGVEQRTLELSRYLQQRGFHVEVFVQRAVGKIVDYYREMNIPVHHVPIYAYTADGGYQFFPAGFLRLWWRLFRGRFGSVLCVQPPSYLFGRIASLPLFGRRVVAMERFLITGTSPTQLYL